jgi:hypothetical protein
MSKHRKLTSTNYSQIYGPTDPHGPQGMINGYFCFFHQYKDRRN